MKDDLNKNRELFQGLAKDLIEANTRTERGLSDRRVQIEDQRRDLFKFLVVLIMAIIGSSYFLKISHSNTLYFSGIIILVIAVILIILYLRESIDNEGNYMYKMVTDSKILFHQQFDLIMEYINRNKFSDESVMEYSRRYQELPFIKELKGVIDNEKHPNINLPMEYFGELINFLFLSGLFLMFGSIKPDYINWIVIVLGEILLFLFSCVNSAKYVSNLFSKPSDYLVKKVLYKKVGIKRIRG